MLDDDEHFFLFWFLSIGTDFTAVVGLFLHMNTLPNDACTLHTPYQPTDAVDIADWLLTVNSRKDILPKIILDWLVQATMLKKNKFKRRPTEPSILPANGEGGKSTDDWLQFPFSSIFPSLYKFLVQVTNRFF